MTTNIGRCQWEAPRRPIHEGDRVRHVCDPVEGVAERIDCVGIPTVAVRLDHGGVAFFAENFLERAP